MVNVLLSKGARIAPPVVGGSDQYSYSYVKNGYVFCRSCERMTFCIKSGQCTACGYIPMWV